MQRRVLIVAGEIAGAQGPAPMIYLPISSPGRAAVRLCERPNSGKPYGRPTLLDAAMARAHEAGRVACAGGCTLWRSQGLHPASVLMILPAADSPQLRCEGPDQIRHRIASNAGQVFRRVFAIATTRAHAAL